MNTEPNSAWHIQNLKQSRQQRILRELRIQRQIQEFRAFIILLTVACIVVFTLMN